MVRQNSDEELKRRLIHEPFSITLVVCVGQKWLQVWDFTQKYSNVNATLVHELKIYPHKSRKVECKKQEKSLFSILLLTMCQCTGL